MTRLHSHLTVHISAVQIPQQFNARKPVLVDLLRNSNTYRYHVTLMKNGLILVNYLVGNNSCSRMKYGIPVLFRQTYFLQRIFMSVN